MRVSVYQVKAPHEVDYLTAHFLLTDCGKKSPTAPKVTPLSRQSYVVVLHTENSKTQCFRLNSSNISKGFLQWLSSPL